MKTEILKMLRETEDYVSGQQICGKLGVSRTAVWKVIRQLQEEGYQIEAVRNRGYRILDGPDVMTREELESLMGTRWAGSRIYYYPETDSTNIRIRQLADEGAPHGTLAVADMQTAGRGRRGRTWESPAGSSIYMSILLRPDLMPSAAPPLTLVMACSVAEGIMDCEDVKVQIKWPNDVIIGVGINVNMTEFPDSIRETATSLRIEAGHKVRRAKLIAAVMKRFEADYEMFMQTGDLSGLMEKYSSMLVNQDRDVRILGVKETYTAHALGIDRNGELIVRREDGTEEKISSGEVSVRGVYGYV